MVQSMTQNMWIRVLMFVNERHTRKNADACCLMSFVGPNQYVLCCASILFIIRRRIGNQLRHCIRLILDFTRDTSC